VSDPKATGTTPTALSVRPLDVDTWPAFARLVEANNGVWGGCWCMGFHIKLGKGRTPAQNRAAKEQLVNEGRTHAALVLEGDTCLGWCQFGSPEELPEIKSRSRYEKDLTALPDWRITCFFTGKGRRRRGVAGRRAPRGARRDRPPWRRHGRGLPRGDRRPHPVGLVPAHRADGRLREPRLHTYAADLPTSLGRHPHRRPGLTSPAQATRNLAGVGDGTGPHAPSTRPSSALPWPADLLTTGASEACGGRRGPLPPDSSEGSQSLTRGVVRCGERLATATTSSRNSLGWGAGMVNVLPVTTSVVTRQVSTRPPAVPIPAVQATTWGRRRLRGPPQPSPRAGVVRSGERSNRTCC